MKKYNYPKLTEMKTIHIQTKCSVCGMKNGKHKMSCKTPSLRKQIPI